MNIKNIIKTPIEKFKKLSKFKKLLVILIIAGGGFLTYKQVSTTSNETTYKFTKVQNGTISNVVSETGEITSTGRTEVKSTIEGIVSEVYVDNGTWVEKGQQLFYVTSSATQAEQAAAWSSYQSAVSSLNSAQTGQITAQANLEQARVTILNQSDTVDNMNDNLNDGNDNEYTQNAIDATNSELYIDNLNFDAKEQSYLNSEQSIAAAQAKVNSAWYAYQATIDGAITAPVTGYVTNLAIAPGQNVDVSTSDVTAANCLVIKSNEETWIKIAVSEMEIIDVQTGQSADITVDALGEDQFEAIVKRVDEIGTNSSGIVNFGVYLLLSEENENIKPGMTVQVDVEVERKENVLVVTSSAIKDYQDEKAVQILDEETQQVIYLPIEVGSSDDINTEIVSGLEKGQQIITSISNSATESSEKSSGGMMMPGMGGGPGK